MVCGISVGEPPFPSGQDRRGPGQVRPIGESSIPESEGSVEEWHYYLLLSQGLGYG